MKTYKFNCTEYEAQMVDAVLKNPKYRHIRDPKAFFMHHIGMMFKMLK